MNGKQLILFIAFAVLTGADSSAQTTEIKPFDTATNDNAATERIYADAVKEHILGNEKEAEVLFLRFLEARPNEAAAYYELARINIKNNNIEKAQQQIRKAITLDSSSKWYKELYANILATRNQYIEAADLFSGLARRYTPSEDFLLKASLLYQRGGKPDKAIGELEELVKKQGPDEDILVQISQLYAKDKNINAAAATLQRLIDANPKEGRYYALLAELYDNNKMPDQAIKVYKDAEQKFPDDMSVLLGIASYYKRKNDAAGYAAYLQKAIANKQVDERTQVTLLVTYLQDADKDTMVKANGLAMTELMVARHPENAAIQGIYGDLLNFNNKPEQALVAYRKSITLDSSNLNIWQQFLFHYTDKPHADSLIYFSEQALAIFPSQAILHYLNGIGYVNKGNFTKAIKSLNTAIDYQPEENKVLLADMYSSLGDAYNSGKDYPNADKSFERALELNQANASVLNNYAYYLSVRKARLDDAERMSRRSLELRPGEATFLDTYGWIFYQQGKYAKAKEMIQQAIDKNGNDADATLYEHLGDIYYQLNDKENAVIQWQKALIKDPSNEQLQLKIKNRKLYE